MEDEQKVRLINEGLSSAFWKEILEPLITQRHDAMAQSLRNPDQARKLKIPDDYIRGQLDFAEMLLNQPKLIAETTSNSLVEERMHEKREVEDEYRAYMGHGAFRED